VTLVAPFARVPAIDPSCAKGAAVNGVQPPRPAWRKRHRLAIVYSCDSRPYWARFALTAWIAMLYIGVAGQDEKEQTMTNNSSRTSNQDRAIATNLQRADLDRRLAEKAKRENGELPAHEKDCGCQVCMPFE
jgi:hypothetical protein